MHVEEVVSAAIAFASAQLVSVAAIVYKLSFMPIGAFLSSTCVDFGNNSRCSSNDAES